MARATPHRILVVRNDKLGDFMLAWPAFALLKCSMPDVRLCALVPPYTEPMARLCPSIDEVIVDPGSKAGFATLHSLLRNCRLDALVALYSTTRVAITSLSSGIPYRLAPATKLAQIFYNHRLTQRRSRSEKPEWDYNLDLVRRFLADHSVSAAPLPGAPYLQFSAEEIHQLRENMCAQHGFSSTSRLVFIHPGSGGSANNLSIEQYAALANTLTSSRSLAFIIGCGPGEAFKGEALAALLQHPHAILSAPGIVDYSRHIACADLFIAGSTGPLHIAGALDVPTAAFYTRRRSATPLRWQTLNSPDRRLAFTPPETADEMDMAAIDIDAAAREISRRLLN